MSKLDKARSFAATAHSGQTRKYGQRPYIYHPEKVVGFLTECGFMDEDLLCAAWLHDTIEDCGVTHSDLVNEFGMTVADLVYEVTHPSITGNRSTRWIAYLDHYSRASTLGQTLKLADRYCNLREYIDYWDDLPTNAKKFINEVYLDESVELYEHLVLADQVVSGLLNDMIIQVDLKLEECRGIC